MPGLFTSCLEALFDDEEAMDFLRTIVKQKIGDGGKIKDFRAKRKMKFQKS